MIQIVFSSSSDITPEEAKKLNGIVIAGQVNFGSEVTYYDGVDLSKEEFFDKMKSFAAETGKLPTTTQISEEAHYEVFKPLLDQGDEIVYICMSSGMSSTIDRAIETVKRLNAEDKITIFDSETITLHYGALVKEAIKARDAGKTRAEIEEYLKDCRERCELMGCVSDITYLKKGGRLKGAQAVMATALNIKPLITIRNLMVDKIGKAIGIGGACKALAKLYAQYEVDYTMPIYIAHSSAPELAARLIKQIKAVRPEFDPIDVGNIGASVGTHIGPGCVGVTFFRKPGTKSYTK